MLRKEKKERAFKRFGVIMMCQCSFILGKKYIIVMSDVDNRGGYACVGAEVIWETSVFCCEPKIVLKNSLNNTLTLTVLDKSSTLLLLSQISCYSCHNLHLFILHIY